MPRVSDERLKELAGMGLTEITLMARELELARKVIEAARDHGRWCSIKLSCRLCAALREYDAGEPLHEQLREKGFAEHPNAQRHIDSLTRKVSEEPRRPSFAEALENFIGTDDARFHGDRTMTWADLRWLVRNARRASGE